MSMRRHCGVWPGAAIRIVSEAPDDADATAAEADPEPGAARPSAEAEAPDDATKPGAQPPGVRCLGFTLTF